jgi:hypothetical protein
MLGGNAFLAPAQFGRRAARFQLLDRRRHRLSISAVGCAWLSHANPERSIAAPFAKMAMSGIFP